MPDDRISIEEFARKIKDARPELANVPDEVLARKVFERRPDLINMVQTTTPRRHAAQPGEGAVHQAGRGLLGPITDIFKPDNLVKMGISSSPFTDPDRSARNTNPATQMTAAMMEDPKKATGSLFGVPGITKEFEEGHPYAAGGRATTESLMWLAPFLKAGKGAAASTFMADTEKLSAPLKATLDSQAATIEKGMEGQFVNVKELRTPLKQVSKALEGLDHSPNTKVGDLAALKETIDKLYDRSKSGMLSWKDLNQASKSINEAAAATKSTGIKAITKKITEPMRAELQRVAEAGGHGPEYDKFIKDYREFSELNRRVDEFSKGKLQTQQIAKQTTGGRKKLLGVGPEMGASKANKLADMNKQLYNKLLKDYEALHKQIKTSPSGGTPPASPAAPTPAGGQLPSGPIDLNAPKSERVMPPNVTAQGLHPEGTKFQVYDRQGNIKGTYSSLKRARNAVDKFDNEYGGYAHHVKPVLPKIPTPNIAVPSGPQTVGSAAGAASDTALFQQAQKELGPNASVSQVAQRAQQLKMQSAGPQPGAGTFMRNERPNPVEHPQVPAPMPAKPKLDPATQAILDKMNGQPF